MYITRGSLTKDVQSAATSLGTYLRSTFPNSKPIQLEYKAGAGDLLVEGDRSTASTIGTALDLILRFVVEPDETPDSTWLMYPFNQDFHAVVHELAELAARSDDREVQARAAYALALCAGAYRAGPLFAPLMYARVKSGDFQTDSALQDASAESVAELIALRLLIEERLAAKLERPLHLGPTFDLSRPGPTQRTAAEADLISNGLLLDVKSNMAAANKSGMRPDVLPSNHLYQLLGYALLDHSDTYTIDKVGIFSARYGTLTEWPLTYVATVMACKEVDFAAERQTVWDFMHEELEFI